MLEELFNLVVALVSVAITLLDPMLQLANGVVIYILTPFQAPSVVLKPNGGQSGFLALAALQTVQACRCRASAPWCQ